MRSNCNSADLSLSERLPSHTARSSALASELFRIRHLDIVVSNYALNGGTSLAMLRTMRQQRPDLAALLVLSNVDTPKDVPSGVRLICVLDGPAALLAETEDALDSRGHCYHRSAPTSQLCRTLVCRSGLRQAAVPTRLRLNVRISLWCRSIEPV